MKTVVVAGALANKPLNGGEAWVRLSWIRGFQRMGLDVYFIEQLGASASVGPDGEPVPFQRSVNREYFDRTVAAMGLEDRSAVQLEGSRLTHGLGWEALQAIADRADVLVNISGNLAPGPLFERFRHRAYVDLDPGYTQLWEAQTPGSAGLADHDTYFTVGLNVGSPDSTIPTDGIRWHPLLPPVVLEDWTAQASTRRKHPRRLRFTTVGSWRGAYGRVAFGGTLYGQKAHEFRRFVQTPRSARHDFELAMNIHPADDADRRDLEANGWKVVDPRPLTHDTGAFRAYVAGSDAEFTVAQGIYVETGSGWFSDRSVRYLASGRPVLIQDTGFSRRLPVGEGIVPFRDLQEATEGADRIADDYPLHAHAARGLAEELFDSDRVLRDFQQVVENHRVAPAPSAS